LRQAHERASSLSVVVVSYNARDLLRSCLNAVAPLGHEVVVVDNASSDGSAELVREEFPGARLVAMQENVGFGAGVNAGMRATGSRYVLVLNPDAWPVDGGIDRLLEHAERAPGAALLGPRLIDPDGKAQRSTIRPPGAFALALWIAFPRLVSGAYGIARRITGSGQREQVREGEFLMGAVLLLRREAVEQIGGFDEAFFMFNEEVDLCFRLRNAGWQIEFVPSATFVHVGGASTKTAPDQMYRELLRSHLRFLAKHRGLREAEMARRLLILALRSRAVFTGSAQERAAAAWLSSGGKKELLLFRA
jgi:GT2 family glycosyltransferase